MSAAELIDTQGIAAALGLGREYVTDRVTKRPDFPAPVLRLSAKVVKWAWADFERWHKAQGIKR